MKSRNSRRNRIPSVALYFPSTGTYYSPRFVSDTSRLRSKGLWLRNHGLATKTVFQMLPSTSLRIRISDGMPDPDGHLWKFTDVYRIDVLYKNSPICTLFPLLTGVHVSDEQICIPPDVIVGKIPCELPRPDCLPGENNVLYRKLFVEELLQSKSNRAGCKRFVSGSFIAYPEKSVKNPLVIDSFLLDNHQQIVIQVREKSFAPVIEVQSSIRIQHMVGKEFCCLRQSALRLGKKVSELHGKNSVRDKMTSSHVCANIGLPHGFDGPMHAFGLHVDTFDPIRSDPVHYGGTHGLIHELTEFAALCIPVLKSRFHSECLVMQRALHSFDEVSPTYLGGNNGISLSINISHNFANSSHYDSLDYGPSIVMWVMDNAAWTNCDQYLVFNNIVETIDNKVVKEGVMIKISDGMIMSFQGNTLRHGTTIRRDSSTGELCPSGNVYGIHFGLSMPTLTALRRARIDQYIREMDLIPKMIKQVPTTSEEEMKTLAQGRKRLKTNLIQFAKQRKTHNDEVI